LVCGKNLRHILASGPEKWNAFRDQNPDWVMLNGTCLPDIHLAHANLQRAFLFASDLHGANLEGVCLERAILRQANLRGANLRYARIDGADLFGADLSGADLRGASLRLCFLRCADLGGADLSTAQGLSYAQLMKALGDSDTRLPDDLPRPATWSAKGARA
jgi:uncharacterized protein YjbI with pentapeptide repeats